MALVVSYDEEWDQGLQQTTRDTSLLRCLHQLAVVSMTNQASGGNHCLRSAVTDWEYCTELISSLQIHFRMLSSLMQPGFISKGVLFGLHLLDRCKIRHSGLDILHY